MLDDERLVVVRAVAVDVDTDLELIFLSGLVFSGRS